MEDEWELTYLSCEKRLVSPFLVSMPRRGCGYWAWTWLDWQWEGGWDGAALLVDWVGCWDGAALMVDWGGCWDGGALMVDWGGCWDGATLMVDWGGCWDGAAAILRIVVYSHSLDCSAYALSSSWNSASKSIPTPSFSDLGLYKHARWIIDQISIQ